MAGIEPGPYLLDHLNPRAKRHNTTFQFHGYPGRTGKIVGVVLHTAEALDKKLEDGDQTAENVAKYLSTTDRIASAHSVVDSDSIITLLPDQFTAFHARGFNSITLGLEIAYKADSWGSNPEREEALLKNASKVCRDWAAIYGIPAIRVSPEDLKSGKKGYISHAEIDPARRTDPGKNFPWEKFLSMVG